MADEMETKGRTQAVLRMLKGEEASDLAKEMGVEVSVLESWKSEFLEAGEGAMSSSSTSSSSDASGTAPPPQDFSETSWFMAAVDMETLEELPDKVDVEEQEYAPRADVETSVRRAFSLRDDSDIKPGGDGNT
jgi:hypothetical protein